MEDKEQTICKKVKGKKFLVFLFPLGREEGGRGRGIYFRVLLEKNKPVKHDSGISLNQKAGVAYGNAENDQIPVAVACCSPGEAGTRATCRRLDPH